MLGSQRCSGLCICCNQHLAKGVRHDTVIGAVKGEKVQWVDDRSCIDSTQPPGIAAQPYCRQRAWVSLIVRAPQHLNPA